MNATPPVMVLTPDMRIDGGVTNYYRQLALDARGPFRYFPVNLAGSTGAVRKLAFLLPNYLRFVRALPGVRCVHVNPSLNARSFYRDAVYAALARLFGKITVVTFHGWSYDFEQRLARSPLRRWWLRRGYAGASVVIVLGETFERRLRALGLPDATPVKVETTIADDTDFDAASIAAPAAADPVNFMFLARAVREKGLFIGLEAFVRCRALLPDVPMHYYVAGDGPDLAEARVRYDSRTDVTFLGHVDDEARRALLRRCHILMFPTYHGEGLPCALLEAMLYGHAVLTRAEGAIPEIVRDGANGLVTTSRDPDVFARAAARLISDAPQFRAVSRRNTALAQARFRSSVVRARLLAIYADVLGDRNGSIAAR